MGIEIRELYKSYGDKKIFKNASFSFPNASRTCIMGASGCGKTTLLYLILGLVAADHGIIHGIDNSKTGIQFQEDRLCESFSAIENVCLVHNRIFSAEQAQNHLKQLGIEDGKQNVSLMSGGMRRRVSLARAVSYNGEILLLDEPFKGMDSYTKLCAAKYVCKYTQGKIVIVVTHDKQDAALLEADTVLYLDH